MMDEEAVLHRDTDLCAEDDDRSCLATNNGQYVPLDQIDKLVMNALLVAVDQDALLSVEFATSEQLLKPMWLEACKACPSCDQGINSPVSTT